MVRAPSATPEQRLAALGLILPPASAPTANYVAHRLIGRVLHLAGQGPRTPDGGFQSGRLGRDTSVAEGYAAARETGLLLLAAAMAALGELSRIECMIRVFGMVNAEPDFADHAKVIDGCSDLFVEILGEAGRHARAAVGMGSLPFRMPVEIEATLLVREA